MMKSSISNSFLLLQVWIILRLVDGLIKWYIILLNLRMMEKLQSKELRDRLLMVELKVLRDRLELLFHSKLDALNAVWDLYHHKLDILCALLEKLQDYQNIASNMHLLSVGRNISAKKLLIKIHQMI